MGSSRLLLLLVFMQLTLSACPLTRWLGFKDDESVTEARPIKKKVQKVAVSSPDIESSLDNVVRAHDAEIEEKTVEDNLPDMPVLWDVSADADGNLLPPRQEPDSEHGDEVSDKYGNFKEEPAVDEAEDEADSEVQTKKDEVKLPIAGQFKSSGKFGDFTESESDRIASYVFSGSPKSKFKGIDSSIARLLSFSRGPIALNSVDLIESSQKAIKKDFNLAEKPFCENFTFDSLGFSKKIADDPTLRNRWTLRTKANAVSEMKRINTQFNKIRRAFNEAKEGGNHQGMELAEQANFNAWKIFSSCVAYSESSIHWKKMNLADWKSGHNQGIFQFDPNQPRGGNLNDCVHNWNDYADGDKISAIDFQKDSNLRTSLVNGQSQTFNSFCGISKLTQNLAQQQWSGASCVNPFKSTYNHFGTLSYDIDNNFLRCTSKHFPDVGDNMRVEITFAKPGMGDIRTPAGGGEAPEEFLDEKAIRKPGVDRTGFEINTHGTEKVRPIIMRDEFWD